MKRGQVTQFIIAGFIILIAVVLVLVARFDYIQDLFEVQRSKLIGVASEVEPVKEYIGRCLEEVSVTSKDIVLLQGGYSEPDEYIEIDIADVGIWYDKGEDVSPGLETIEVEIGKVVDSLLPLCLSDFDIEDYELDIKKTDTMVIIKEKEIIMQSKVNIDANYKDTIFAINEKFNNKYDSDLYDIYRAARTIVDMEVNNPKTIELTTLADFGYDINFFRYNEEEIVYMITTEDTSLFWGNRF